VKEAAPSPRHTQSMQKQLNLMNKFSYYVQQKYNIVQVG
jgi:hypothetical protein